MQPIILCTNTDDVTVHSISAQPRLLDPSRGSSKHRIQQKQRSRSPFATSRTVSSAPTFLFPKEANHLAEYLTKEGIIPPNQPKLPAAAKSQNVTSTEEVLAKTPLAQRAPSGTNTAVAPVPKASTAASDVGTTQMRQSPRPSYRGRGRRRGWGVGRFRADIPRATAMTNLAARESPAEEASAKAPPGEEPHAKEAPTKAAPAKETPGKEAPASETSADESPVKSLSSNSPKAYSKPSPQWFLSHDFTPAKGTAVTKLAANGTAATEALASNSAGDTRSQTDSKSKRKLTEVRISSLHLKICH